MSVIIIIKKNSLTRSIQLQVLNLGLELSFHVILIIHDSVVYNTIVKSACTLDEDASISENLSVELGNTIILRL